MTPAPVPARAIDALIDRVNALGQQVRHDEFELHRCEAEARKLLAVPDFQAEAASVLGMLAAIKDDLSSLVKWHEMAICISGGAAFTHDHYATSLLSVFEYERAMKHARIAFEALGNRGALAVMIQCTEALGEDTAALEYIAEWERRFGEQCPVVTMVESADMDELFTSMDAGIASPQEYVGEAEFDIVSFREMADAIRGGNRA